MKPSTGAAVRLHRNAVRDRPDSLSAFKWNARPPSPESTYGERKRNFVGQHFWARGYYVSTVGRDEQAIREYIKNQEVEDRRLEQLNLWR